MITDAAREYTTTDGIFVGKRPKDSKTPILINIVTRAAESWERWERRSQEIWVKKHVSQEIWSIQKEIQEI